MFRLRTSALEETLDKLEQIGNNCWFGLGSFGHGFGQTQRLAAQARMHGSRILLCTEKDAMNLPARSTELLLEDSVDLYWLKIGVEIENEEALLEMIESKLGA